MKKVIALRIGIGSTVRENIPDQYFEFYKWICEKIGGNTIEVSNLDKSSSAFLPMSNSEMQESPNKVCGQIADYFKEGQRRCDFLVLDMSGPYEGIMREQILNHIGSSIQWLLIQIAVHKVILLLDHLPVWGHSFLKFLHREIAQKSLIIFDLEGFFLPALDGIDEKFQYEFKANLKELRTKPLDLLKHKLVRRLGHFKWSKNNEHKACHRYFYDASKSIKEIVDLLKEKVAYHKTKKLKIDAIIYHATYSPWLEKALIIIQEDLKIPIFSYEKYLKEKKKFVHLSSIIIVVDLINTGHTIREIYLSVLKRNSQAKLLMFSILTTDLDNKEKSLRNIEINGKIHTIQCLLKVDQKREEPQNCNMCHLGIPFSNTEDENYDSITTYDMWELNDSAGYINEREAPKHRKNSLGWIPDYAKMIDANGSWIAYKFEKLLESYGLNTPDLVIITPAETVPKAFSTYIKHIMNVNTIIKIPRDILDSFGTESPNEDIKTKNKLDKNENGWRISLNSLTQKNVVILDEFYASGGTLKAIKKIMDSFKKNINCYLAIVDFDPKNSVKCEIPTHFLYQVQRGFVEA